MDKKRIPKKVTDRISAYVDILRGDNFPVSSVYLFGSYARGSQKKGSDIDLCIISQKMTGKWEDTAYLWKKVPDDTDPVIEPVGYSPEDFEEEIIPLISEIKRYGIRMDV